MAASVKESERQKRNEHAKVQLLVLDSTSSFPTQTLVRWVPRHKINQYLHVGETECKGIKFKFSSVRHFQSV